MNPENRELFNKVFKALCDERNAFSNQDRLKLAEELLAQAEKEGKLPISPTQWARVRVDDPRVQAILAGETVALGGGTLGEQPTLKSKLANMTNGQKMALMAGMLLVMVLFMAGLYKVSTARPKATPTPTLTPTLAVTATSTPAPGLPEDPFSVIDNPEDSSTKPNDPVSVEFGGLAFVLGKSKLKDQEWLPAVAEWLDGSQLRRVVAVPYSAEVGQAVQGMKFGDPVRLRLGSGEIVNYRVVTIERVKRHQIEYLSALSPSLAVILHSEHSGERYIVIADAVQGCDSEWGICYTPTPTLPPGVPSPTPTNTYTPTPTPTATLTSTPALTFAPPVQAAVIETEEWSVTNNAAGLRLDIVACSRVTQIGSQSGRFVVCDVTLTATRDGAAYSGQALAITEHSLVVSSANWWPEPVQIVGQIGDGHFAKAGDTISGKLAGSVTKKGGMSSSDPVIIWEQDGIRYLIYLEH